MNAPHASVVAWFCEVARQRGEQTALRIKRLGVWDSVSWRDYEDNVRVTGCAMLAAGLGRGARIAVVAEPSPVWNFAVLGAQGIGCAAIGIAPSESAAAVREMLEQCSAQLLIVGSVELLDGLLPSIAGLPALRQIVCLEDRAAHEASSLPVVRQSAFLDSGRHFHATHPQRWASDVALARPDDVGLLAFTSGAVADPRLVQVTNASLLFQMRALDAAVPAGPADDQLAILPSGHVLETLVSVCRPVATGAVMNFGESQQGLVDALREVAPQVLVAPPRVWEILQSTVMTAIADAPALSQWGFRKAFAVGGRQASGLALSVSNLLVLDRVRAFIGMGRLRKGLAIGGALSPDVLNWFRAIGVELAPAFSLTEATGLVSCAAAGDMRPGSVGKALEGTEITIAPSGEIQVRGPHVCAFAEDRGSVRVLTDAQGWLSTGDCGHIEADGTLVHEDRVTHMSATADGGVLSPAAIEIRIRRSDFIREALVFAGGSGGLVCLLAVDHEQAAREAQSRRLAFSGFAALVRLPEIRDLLRREIEGVNGGLPPALRITGFGLIDAPLSMEAGELTPLRILRRRVVLERYGRLVVPLDS